MEPLTASAIATLAFTKPLEKTIEKFTEADLRKIGELRQKIWNKLRGNLKAEKALTVVAQGNKSELARLAVYLQDAMDDDPQFTADVQDLAREVNAGKPQNNSDAMQNVYENSRDWQTKVDGGISYVGVINLHGKGLTP